MPETPDATPKTTPLPRPLAAGAERIRESAKWLLAAFGAVGAVVVGGVALSDLGKVDGPARGWAVVLVVVSLTGVAIAILAAGSIVTQSYMTLDEIVREHVVSDPVLLVGSVSIAQMRDDYVAAITRNRLTAAAYFDAEDPSIGLPPPETIIQAKQQRAQAAANRVTFYERITLPVLERSSFEKLKDGYDKARWGMGAGAILAVGGIVGYVAIVSGAAAKAKVVGDVPVRVSISVLPTRTDFFKHTLGATCDVSKLGGTAIANDGDRVVVVTDKTSTCSRELLVLSPDDAAVTTGVASTS
jgi:hypothetical protein